MWEFCCFSSHCRGNSVCSDPPFWFHVNLKCIIYIYIYMYLCIIHICDVHIYIYIPRDSLRQKFLPQFKKGAFLDLRHFFLICGVFLELRQNLFSVFSPPRFAAEIGGNAAEIGGNAAEIPGKQTVLRRFCFGCGVFLCLRLIFWNAAGISAAMRCGRNFRRRKF